MLSVTEQQNSAPLVLVDRPSAHVAVVTLNRPERMNSMAFDVMVPLRSALDELSYDNSVRAIVLTGAGRGFSSGADHKSAGAVPHVDGLTRPTYALRSMEGLDDVPPDMHGKIAEAVFQGGLPVVNHPAWSLETRGSWGGDWQEASDDIFDSLAFHMEIYNHHVVDAVQDDALDLRIWDDLRMCAIAPRTARRCQTTGSPPSIETFVI